METKNRRSRQRAVNLCPESRERLLSALSAKWQETDPGRRLTREFKAELLGLSVVTSERLLRGGGVDRATVSLAFKNVALELRESDLSPNVESEKWHEPTVSGQEIPAVAVPEAPEPSIRLKWLWSAIAMIFLALAAIGYRQLTFKPWQRQLESSYKIGLEKYHQGDLEGAQKEVDKILELARTNDSARWLAESLRLAGDVSSGRGNLETAEEQFSEACAIWDRLDYSWREAELLEAVGNTQLRRGRLDEAQASFSKSLSLQRKHRSAVGIAMAARGLGSVAYEKRDPVQANTWFTQALAHLDGLKEPAMVNDIRGRMALVKHLKGDSEGALKDLMQSLEFWQREKSQRWIALIEMDIGIVAGESGSTRLSAEYLARSCAGFERIGDAFNEIKARRLLGRLFDHGSPTVASKAN